ncbi:MAG: hypothetical protein CXT73_00970 [Methanobacteriota archaeon]|jgi:hypothetical protein|nr:MAG: hypothetical protein CXT73_00970 [Euryarchaeota archaeon]
MKDTRARLSLPQNSDILETKGGKINPILLPLKKFHGIIWPYTPTINVSHQAEYGEYDITHSNYPTQYFSKSRPPNLQVSGPLTAQTAAEGHYMIACLHFLRIVTKMHFGMNDEKRGTPPPVLKFSAYGDLMFSNIPVLVRSFAYDLGQDIDYIDVETDSAEAGFNDGFNTKVPTMLNLVIDLVVQQTPSKLRTTFTMNDFKSGKLVKDGFI